MAHRDGPVSISHFKSCYYHQSMYCKFDRRYLLCSVQIVGADYRVKFSRLRTKVFTRRNEGALKGCVTITVIEEKLDAFKARIALKLDLSQSR